MFGNFTRCRQHSNKLLQIDLAFFFIIIEESRERQTIEISTFREKDTGILIRELLLQGLINIIAAQLGSCTTIPPPLFVTNPPSPSLFKNLISSTFRSYVRRLSFQNKNSPVRSRARPRPASSRSSSSSPQRDGTRYYKQVKN